MLGLALVVGLLLTAQAQTWVARYNGEANDEDLACGAASDNTGTYVAGSSWGAGTGYDFVVAKYGAVGESLWTARYDYPAHYDDLARAIAVGSGRVVVAGGTTNASFYTDMLTVSHAQSGGDRWAMTYDGVAGGNDHAQAVAIDAAGSVYSGGYVFGTGTGWDYLLVKYSSTGAQQWAATYSTIDEDYITGIAVRDGDVYVTGCSGSPYTLSWDWVTIRFSAATGDTVWTRRLNGPADSDDEAWGIALDPDGNVVVTGGTTSNTTGVDYTTVKYSPAGGQEWLSRYDGPGSGIDWAYALAVDGDGNVIVTGGSSAPGTDHDYATVKYGPAGNELWVARYDGPSSGFDEARAVAVDGDGNIFVTGSSTGTGTRGDYATVRYSPAGGEDWVARYDGPASRLDEGLAIAFDSQGGVCVTGNSDGSGTGTDIATLRYPSAGAVAEGRPASLVGDGPGLRVQPNPLVGSAIVGYSLSVAGAATVRLHDAAGRLVAVLADGLHAAGEHRVALSRRTAGTALAEGVYFIRLQAGGAERSVKVVVSQ
jgi:uncharacterized delta-60 repeat protein